MGIESFVRVSITRQTQGVTQAGFGTALILGPNAEFSGVRSYRSLLAMADDFATNDAEYLAATALFSQTPRPREVKVRKVTTPVAQVNTLTPIVANASEYAVKVNGIEFTFTSDADATAGEIVAGLVAAINGGTEPVTASGTTTLILTSDVAGQSFSVEIMNAARFTQVETTPNVGVASDILAAAQEDSDWYCLLLSATDDVSIKEAAKTIEGMRRIFAFRNNDSDVRTSVTNDLVSDLKAKNYFRTFVMYQSPTTDFGEAGFCGRLLPTDPGSETWAFKTLAGVTVNNWTDAEQTYLNNKNANYYIPVGGKSITVNGKVVGGEYVDVIRFADWIQARMEETIFADLTRLDKIPFTDGGIAIIENDIRSVLKRGQRIGGIAPDVVNEDGSITPGFTITVPKAAEISFNDKAARRLTGISFTAILAGAIHEIEIQGVVTL